MAGSYLAHETFTGARVGWCCCGARNWFRAWVVDGFRPQRLSLLQATSLSFSTRRVQTYALTVCSRARGFDGPLAPHRQTAACQPSEVEHHHVGLADPSPGRPLAFPLMPVSIPGPARFRRCVLWRQLLIHSLVLPPSGLKELRTRLLPQSWFWKFISG